MNKGNHIIKRYDQHEYNFIELLTKFFDVKKLCNLHKYSNDDYKKLFEVGKDSSTIFHAKFYDQYHKGWGELQSLYDLFIDNVIASQYDEDFLYQKFPTFRVHLPNNVAVGAFHNDAQFNHPKGEVNYILPLTDSYFTASVWLESEPGKEDFAPLSMRVGEFIQFNGNELTHGNKTNLSGLTRCSMDFRVLPISKYNEAAEGNGSVTLGTKFKDGQYYSRFTK